MKIIGGVGVLHVRYSSWLERGKCLKRGNELIFSKFDEHLHSLLFDEMDELGLSSFVACANNSEMLYKAVFEKHGFNDRSLGYCIEYAKDILNYKINGWVPSLSVVEISMEPFPSFYGVDLPLWGGYEKRYYKFRDNG